MTTTQTGEDIRKALNLARGWKESGDAKTFDSLPEALAGFASAINGLTAKFDALEAKVNGVAQKMDAVQEAGKPVDPYAVFNDPPPRAEKAEVAAARAAEFEQLREKAKAAGDPYAEFIGLGQEQGYVCRPPLPGDGSRRL